MTEPSATPPSDPRSGTGSLAVGPDLPPLGADAHMLAPLLSFAREAPNRPIFAVRDGVAYRDVTSSEFLRQVRRVAAGLR